nr:F-box domain, leucine-rich repeat domain, L domain-like protein [Tanacetum cinerariifolium]
MRRLEAMGTYIDDEINHLARGGKQRGHIVGVGRVLPARATASPNMFSQFESGGASGSGGCGDEEEGPTFSSRIVAGEGIPYERSPMTFPRRQVVEERNPQRQVAGESPKLSLGKALNVVVSQLV